MHQSKKVATYCTINGMLGDSYMWLASVRVNSWNYTHPIHLMFMCTPLCIFLHYTTWFISLLLAHLCITQHQNRHTLSAFIEFTSLIFASPLKKNFNHTNLSHPISSQINANFTSPWMRNQFQFDLNYFAFSDGRWITIQWIGFYFTLYHVICNKYLRRLVSHYCSLEIQSLIISNGRNSGSPVKRRCALPRSTPTRACKENKVWWGTRVTHGRSTWKQSQRSTYHFLNRGWRQLRISRRRPIATSVGFRHGRSEKKCLFVSPRKARNVEMKTCRSWTEVKTVATMGVSVRKTREGGMQERIHQRWVGWWQNLPQALRNAPDTHHSTILHFFPLNLTQMMTIHHEWASPRYITIHSKRL
jgi:hypothetical protein